MTRLDCSSCVVYCHCVELMDVSVVRRALQLVALDLSDNRIGAADACCRASLCAFGTLRYLKRLNLDQNGLVSIAPLVADASFCREHLEFLSVARNNLVDGTAFAGHVARLPRLRVLFMHHNPMLEHGDDRAVRSLVCKQACRSLHLVDGTAVALGGAGALHGLDSDDDDAVSSGNKAPIEQREALPERLRTLLPEQDTWGQAMVRAVPTLSNPEDEATFTKDMDALRQAAVAADDALSQATQVLRDHGL